MTAPIYDYPIPATLSTIEQITLPALEMEMNNPFLQNFPDRPYNDTLIMWEQMDNFTGLMNFRGYGNPASRVNQVGIARYVTQPLVYGEKVFLSEEQLTRRRLMGTFGQRIDISDLVAMAQNQLLIRRLQRKAYNVAQFVLNGTYTALDGSGVTISGDSWTPPSYSPATYAWSDHVNSTPLYDIMQVALIPFGQSVQVGPESTIYINRIKFNDLVLNRNANDFWGFRDRFGSTTGNSLQSINAVLMYLGLPQVAVFDGFYLADNSTRKGNPVRFIPTSNGVLFAKRTSGSLPGAFAITYNAQSNAASPYTRVRYDDHIPQTVEVHDGFNGAPIIEYPGTVVVLSGI